MFVVHDRFGHRPSNDITPFLFVFHSHRSQHSAVFDSLGRFVHVVYPIVLAGPVVLLQHRPKDCVFAILLRCFGNRYASDDFSGPCFRRPFWTLNSNVALLVNRLDNKPVPCDRLTHVDRLVDEAIFTAVAVRLRLDR